MLVGKIGSPVAIARIKYSVEEINNAGIKTEDFVTGKKNVLKPI
ncbi:hypothetical protein [Clostridium chromiireducens]|nr:hypothetical protein [Clostridium chromiireducens]